MQRRERGRLRERGKKPVKGGKRIETRKAEGNVFSPSFRGEALSLFILLLEYKRGGWMRAGFWGKA